MHVAAVAAFVLILFAIVGMGMMGGGGAVIASGPGLSQVPRNP